MLIYDYKLSGKSIKRVTQVNDLGINFDSNLSFKNHIISIARKASRNLGFLKRSCSLFTSENALKTVYFHMVRSTMEYNSIIWNFLGHPTILEKIQKRFIKFLCIRTHTLYNEHNYESMLQIFNIQPLTIRRQRTDLIYLFKCIHSLINCQDIVSEINFHVPRISARHNLTFHIPQSRTNIRRNSPLIRLPILYNNNPSACDLFSSNLNEFIKSIRLTQE